MTKAMGVLCIMVGCGGCAGWTKASNKWIVEAAEQDCAIRGGKFHSWGEWWKCSGLPDVEYLEVEGERD